MHSFCNQRNTGFKSLRWLFYGALCDVFSLIARTGFSGSALADKNQGVAAYNLF
jgi:hypothetical protein